jgi:hypothetical protein
MIYDSKRNCLWMTYDKEIFKYDCATGTAVRQEIVKPKALEKWIFSGGEAVYLPDADLILAMTPHE